MADQAYPADRRQRLYDFIVEHKRKNDGNSPTHREMMEAIGVTTTSMIAYYLDKLEIAGLITRNGGRIKVTGGCWDIERNL